MMEAIANHTDPTMDVVAYAAPWFVSSLIHGPEQAEWRRAQTPSALQCFPRKVETP